MKAFTKKTIPIVDIYLDPENPRYDPIQHQREALTNQLHPNNRGKLFKLAEDIIKYGTDPSHIPIVTAEIRNNQPVFIVREGNRRIAALQLLSNSKLAASLIESPTTRKKFDSLIKQFENNPITEIECVIYETYDTAPRHWIKLNHTGENGGAGTVMWDGKASARFSGGSVGLQAIDLVIENVELTQEEKESIISPNIKITTIDRMLLTPAESRKILGLDLVDGNLTIVENYSRSLSNLTALILEIANGKLTSRKLNSSSERINTAERIAKSSPRRKLLPNAPLPSAEQKPKESSKQKTTKPTGLRNTVATRQRITIAEPRCKDIYYELQHLNITKFPNASAILIRVFFELSIDEYARINKIDIQAYDKSKKPIRDKQIKFKDKVLKVVEHMKKIGVSRHVTAQAHAMATNPDKLFYFERLHDYLHNPNYAPLRSDLPNIWDNLQAFAEALWK